MLGGWRLPALVLAFALIAAPSAHAGLSTWTGLPGLDAPSGAQWIRDFQFESFPPTTGTTVYAATEGQGVFRSQFGGAAWSSFNTGLENVSAKYVRTLLVSGTDVYAGTDLGVFKSEGGGSWKPLAQGTETNPAQPEKLNESVQSLVSIPGGTMLAGVFSGGVYRSTDAGKTWTPPAPGNGMPAHQTVTSIVSFPFVPGGPVFAASGTGIYRSFNQGATWTLASDGIPGSAGPNFLWVDSNRPNVHYAGTGASGMYRSIDSGLTWSEINTGLLAVRTRGLQIFTGDDGAVLYAATEDGLWAGRAPGETVPAAPVWRQVTSNGLGNNTIMWALTAPALPGVGGAPGLFAGTQSNGGYFLSFEPPDSTCPENTPNTTAECPRIIGTPQEGKTLQATRGQWTGTEPIDRAIQWQRCTGSTPGSCEDISNQTDDTYLVTEDDDVDNVRFRVKVTATNPFPSFDVVERFSTLTGVATANPDNFPGSQQANSPSVSVQPIDHQSAPEVGDKVYAEYGIDPSGSTDGWFNPKATGGIEFQWMRCSNINFNQSCTDIPGATSRQYTLVVADGRRRMRVRVTGTNPSGSLALTSDDTNAVISEPAEATEQPALFGDAYPGETLVGTVGGWKDPTTGFRRQWLRCESDGTFCTNIQELESGDPETGPSYNVREGDLGYTIRMRVIADVNGDITDGLDNAKPNAVEVETPPSAVVTTRPVAAGGGGGGAGDGGAGGGGAGGGGPGAVAPDSVLPVVTRLSLTNKKFALGPKATPTTAAAKKGTTFKFRLSEPATATLTIDRLLAGRKVGKKCVAPSRKNRKAKKCTRPKRAVVLTRRNLAVGARAVAFSGRFGKKKLTVGAYQVTVVAKDAAGNKSKAAKTTFRVVRR